MSLLSIYITNYNYEKYIEESIESVLNQSFQDFEIIIIDDGSTDNSKDIIETYIDNPKIRVVYQKNKGLNVSNNIAMRLAKGKYLMRLDADDYLEKNALETLVSILENDDDLGLVFPDYFLVDAEGNLMAKEQRHSFGKEVSLLDQPAHGACTMIRLQFLKDLGGYNESFTCQDGYDLWIKFISNYKVTNVNEPLFYYRQHGSNLTTNENRILNTRAEIKETFIKEQKIATQKTICIIPVRGSQSGSKLIALKELNGKTLLEHKIENALNSKYVSRVVVTSEDDKIEALVKEKFPSQTKMVFIKRPVKLAEYNSGLIKSVKFVLDHESLKDEVFESIMALSVEFPFVDHKNIDDAIITMSIFNSDSVISVRPDNASFFQHHGDGMKNILNQNNFTRLERDAIYKYTGGILLCKTDNLLKNDTFFGDKVGHIVVNQQAALEIKSDYDFNIAQMLMNKV